MKRFLVFTFSSTWRLELAFSLMVQNANYWLSIVHASLPVPLSLTVDAHSACDCPHCAPFFGVPSLESSLDTPLLPLQRAQYLGSYITPTSSSNPDVDSRCSQTSFAFKQLDPFSRHPLVSQKFKLRVYTQIVQPIFLHGSESQVYSQAQITKIDSLHHKALRQIFN